MTKITRTWRIDADTVARLERVCQRTGVYSSPLVDLMLQSALNRLETGQLALVTRPGRPILDRLEETEPTKSRRNID